MHKLLFLGLSAAALFVAGSGTARAQNQQPPPPPSKLEKIADDLYVISGDGGNTTVYLSGEGVLLVDDKFDRDFDDIQAKVKSLTDQPVKYIINTHAHPDHTGGNPKFPNAQIIAHVNARAIMLDRKLPGLPTITYTDEMRINLGGKEVIARHFSSGHTNGDTMVYFPARKVVAMGDMYNNGTSGVFIDYRGNGSITEWTKTLDGPLENWDIETVVPGHGSVVKRADLAKSRADVEAMRNRVRAMVRAGTTKEAVAKVLVDEFHWNPTGQGVRNSVDGLMLELKP